MKISINININISEHMGKRRGGGNVVPWVTWYWWCFGVILMEKYMT
jgi:hypothetical protein